MGFITDAKVKLRQSTYFLSLVQLLNGLVSGEDNRQMAILELAIKLRDGCGVSGSTSRQVTSREVIEVINGGCTTIRTHGDGMNLASGLSHPLTKTLSHECNTRSQEQDTALTIGVFLSQSEGCESLTCATCHDEFATVSRVETTNNGINGFTLMGTSIILGNLACLPFTDGRPIHGCFFQVR